MKKKASSARALHKALLYKRMVRRIRDRNRKFVKLNKKEQRIKIWKDIIKDLDSQKLVADTGTYLRVSESLYNADAKEQLCDVLESTSCVVCGIGATFVAAVKLWDKFEVGRFRGIFNNDNIMRSYLRKWFDAEQLYLVETAFEGRVIHGRVKVADEKACKQFVYKYNDRNGRLKAICLNAIANGGIFKPQEEKF